MNPLYVVGVGAVTPLGFDALRTLASLRSRLDAFRTLSVVGESGKELVAARVSGYAEATHGARRYAAFAVAALKEALGDLPRGEWRRVVVFLGLPRASRPGAPAGLAPIVCAAVSDQLGIARENIRAVTAGRVSAHLSLAEARLLCDRGVPCLVGGVDTLSDSASLVALSKAGKLKEDWDGFIAGEGAAFVRVSGRPGNGAWGRAAPEITGLGWATETADGSAEHPLVGVAVNQAVRDAARDAGVTDADFDLRINDVNGERASFEDDSFGFVRFFRTPRSSYLEVLHPSSYLGEMGAAGGGIALLWAAANLELGLGDRRCVLVTASDERDRAALVLRKGRTASSAPPVTAVRADREALLVHANSPRDGLVDDPYGLHVEGVDQGHRGLLSANLDGVATSLVVIVGHHEEGVAPWEDAWRYEDRLIAHADAIAWGGRDGQALASERLESDEPEDAAAAAIAFLSWAGGRGIADALIKAGLQSSPHARWICNACIYGPRPTAAAALLAMMSVPDLSAGALEAARIAGVIDRESIVNWLQRSTLATDVVRVCGWQAVREWWRRLAPMVDGSFRSDQEAMLAALVLSDDPQSTLARLEVRRFSDAPLVWTLASMRSRRSLIVDSQAFDEPLTVEALEAMGWCGESGAQRWLLDALERDDAALRAAAARALKMIYGRAPQESVEDDSERVSPAKRLAQDPAVWIKSIIPSPHPPLRLGKPFGPQSPVRTLAWPDLGTRDRTIAAWEHVLWSGTPLGFHPRQLTRLQRRELGQLRGSAG